MRDVPFLGGGEGDWGMGRGLFSGKITGGKGTS